MAVAVTNDKLQEATRKGVVAAVASARSALLGEQRPDGHWCYEFEADCTIPAEYVLFLRYLGERRPELETKIAVYLRARQAEHGGWPLYPGGDLDISCSVKVYFALKLIGDDENAPHMRRAREAILARGGAARANVFTRIALAIFGQLPWRGVPFMPPEIMLLPRWFFFHIDKVAYWSRCVMVPLFVIYAHKARAANPQGIGVRELFTVDPAVERDYFPVRSMLNRVILLLERTARPLEGLIPGWIRRRALARAETWIVPRCNDGGLGAIFPAMINAYMAMGLLGHDPGAEPMLTARKAIEDLLVERETDAYCQPCVSPVWDTGLACLALLEEGSGEAHQAVGRALGWLAERQLLDDPGDWRTDHPGLAGGGWAFQYENAYYPDLDDTAVVAWAMHRSADRDRYGDAIFRAADWLRGMQSKNGGFAAFDSDNMHYRLNEIPFADHGALLDPPTSDVSARCMALFGQLGRPGDRRTLERVVDYLRREQEDDGSWFGRWGTNYIYGTWSVLAALEHVEGIDRGDMVDRGAVFLESIQNPDGGWGEDNDSYLDRQRSCAGDPSTAAQTAWAVLGLMAAGRTDSDAVRRGAEFLMKIQGDDGSWDDALFNAPGFPRVFYLLYHGYSRFFPLWALARFRNHVAGTTSADE
jgi:squalene-hopene/tetraprenyl-beta-curcumene cyclase